VELGSKGQQLKKELSHESIVWNVKTIDGQMVGIPVNPGQSGIITRKLVLKVCSHLRTAVGIEHGEAKVSGGALIIAEWVWGTLVVCMCARHRRQAVTR
jgi:hypothetical protein